MTDKSAFAVVKVEIDKLADEASPEDFNTCGTDPAPYAVKTAAVYARHGWTMEEYHREVTSGAHVVAAAEGAEAARQLMATKRAR